MSRREAWLTAAGIFVAALAVRVVAAAVLDFPRPEDTAYYVGVARNLVEVMATVSPGAKKGSTAPFSRAEFVLLERGGEQPRTLANAFLQPVKANGANVLAESATKLMEQRHALAEMYGDAEGTTTLSTIHDISTSGVARMPLRQALEAVFQATE